MSDKPIAPCHFCGKPCKVEVLGWKNCKYFVRCGTQDDGMFIIGCGYGGPIVDSREEAIAKHNAIARPSVSTAELEKLAIVMGNSADNASCLNDAETIADYANQLRALISKATNGRGK